MASFGNTFQIFIAGVQCCYFSPQASDSMKTRFSSTAQQEANLVIQNMLWIYKWLPLIVGVHLLFYYTKLLTNVISEK